MQLVEDEMNVLNVEKRLAVLNAMVEGNSVRSTGANEEVVLALVMTLHPLPMSASCIPPHNL